jgi:hypothetical protein
MTRQKNTTRFVVKGRGRFPVDMLRYDACWPASSEDAGKITRLIADADHPDRFSETPVTEVALTVAPGYGPPTVARWNSYGWAVAS